MSPRDRLHTLGEQEGFTVEEESGIVRASRVPCLLQEGTTSTCTIEESFDPQTGKPNTEIGTDLHVVRITTYLELDGLVYGTDGTPLGSRINGDGKTWSEISIRSDSAGDESARDVVHRYAKQIIGAKKAFERGNNSSSSRPDPFKIPNTFEGRAGITKVQDRVRDQNIIIVGLGGTGAHLLDLLVKTPVQEIHVLDNDSMGWHNYMRAPGSPTEEEIELQHVEPPLKVDYYRPKYSPLREGLELDATRVESGDTFRSYLEDHLPHFAFVCVDQLRDSDSPRQDVIYRTLSQAAIPFIDSGVSISVEDDIIRGSITTSYHEAGSTEWERTIPNARLQGDLPGYRNVQLPEINAMAASLAVMEWRRRTGQYVSEFTSSLHKFKFEVPKIVIRS